MFSQLTTSWTVRGSKPGEGEIFRTCPDWLWGPLSLLYNGYRVFPKGKKRPGSDADLLVPWTRKSIAIPLLTLWAVRTVQSISACTVELYLYSPCGPYGLYRASVPVQYSYTSTLPVGRTACTETQCLYSRAIPLLPLWAVRPVQSLSACTVQLYLYSPQYLYTKVHFTFLLAHVFCFVTLNIRIIDTGCFNGKYRFHSKDPMIPIATTQPSKMKTVRLTETPDTNNPT